MTFERVYTAIIDKCPHLAAKNTYVIYEWLASGYDTDKDILPAIEYATKHIRKAIHSFSFFTGSIRRQNEIRLKQALKPRELTQGEQDAARARAIAFRTRKINQSHPTDERWLERYEKENGQIII